jgi:hypothetical protein
MDQSKYQITQINTTVPQWWKMRKALEDKYRVRREAIHKISLIEYFSFKMTGRRLTVSLITERETGRRLCLPYRLQYGGRGLYDYQVPAVAHLCEVLLRRGAAVDGSDTGLGKTFVAICACVELGMRPAVICHKIGIGIWAKVCRQFGVNPYFIVNWEFARTGNFPAFRFRKTGWKSRHYLPKIPDKCLLIWDEIHVASNMATWNSLLWRSAHHLPNLSISATLADRLDRLAGLLYVLKAWEQATPNFLSWFNRRFKGNRPVQCIQDMKRVRKILYPTHGVRLSYNDPAVKRHFPTGVYLVDLISLDPRFATMESRAYRATIRKIAIARSQGEVMAAELHYRQLAEMLKVSILAEQATYLMAAGKSVLIFVNFLETLRRLSRTLKTNCLCFGEQEKYGLSRESSIRRFQENRSKIIILTSGSGGQSISLHDMKGGHQRVSLICPNYSAIIVKQILGRTLRAGSRTIPIMKLVYAANTVEAKVAESVSKKLDNLSALNDGDLMEPDIFNLKGVNRGDKQGRI